MQVSLECVKALLIYVDTNSNIYNLTSNYSKEEIDFNMDKLLHLDILEKHEHKLKLTYDGEILLKLLKNKFKYHLLKERLSKFQSMNLTLIIQEARFLLN
ncbi:hypothetical protein [Clostridium baratii]|uniref:hypothetical protein n=1 Tax=Clostridium baratii TaxID=1561 RepID=UPI0030D5F7AD